MAHYNPGRLVQALAMGLAVTCGTFLMDAEEVDAEEGSMERMIPAVEGLRPIPVRPGLVDVLSQ